MSCSACSDVGAAANQERNLEFSRVSDVSNLEVENEFQNATSSIGTPRKRKYAECAL